MQRLSTQRYRSPISATKPIASLITREPHATRILEPFDCAAVCADAFDTAPYTAQSHILTARRNPGETVEMDVDEVERWTQVVEPSLVGQW
jgi:hypothetical protein